MLYKKNKRRMLEKGGGITKEKTWLNREEKPDKGKERGKEG